MKPTGYHSASAPYLAISPATPRNDAAERYSPEIAAAFHRGPTRARGDEEVGCGAGQPNPVGADRDGRDRRREQRGAPSTVTPVTARSSTTPTKSRSACSASRTYSRPTPYSSGYTSTASTSQFSRMPSTADGAPVPGTGRVEQRDCADGADHAPRQPQRQSELGADQTAHQRVADLCLLLHLDPGAHHAGAAAVGEHHAFAVRPFAAGHRASGSRIGSRTTRSRSSRACRRLTGSSTAGEAPLARSRTSTAPSLVRSPVDQAQRHQIRAVYPLETPVRANGFRACSTESAPDVRPDAECSRA